MADMRIYGFGGNDTCSSIGAVETNNHTTRLFSWSSFFIYDTVKIYRNGVLNNTRYYDGRNFITGTGTAGTNYTWTLRFWYGGVEQITTGGNSCTSTIPICGAPHNWYMNIATDYALYADIYMSALQTEYLSSPNGYPDSAFVEEQTSLTLTPPSGWTNRHTLPTTGSSIEYTSLLRDKNKVYWFRIGYVKNSVDYVCGAMTWQKLVSPNHYHYYAYMDLRFIQDLALTPSINSVALSWTNYGTHTNNIVQIYSGGSYHDVATLAGSSTSYTVTGLTCGTPYVFRMKSVVSGSDFYSADYSATTTQPTINASVLTQNYDWFNNHIDLNWTIPNTSYTVIHDLQRKELSGGTYATIYSVTGNTPHVYSDTGITSGTTYYYKLKITYTACLNDIIIYSNEIYITTIPSIIYSGFTSNGTMVIPEGYLECQYLIVAGGGAGGNTGAAPYGAFGGGGGAGAILYGIISNPSGGSYSIVIGSGGTATHVKGGDSNFSGLTAYGGGRGGSGYTTNNCYGFSGGCGGGGGTGQYNVSYKNFGIGGIGIQGYSGGTTKVIGYNTYSSAGGGSIMAVGGISISTGTGQGGVGLTSSISGGSYTFGKGGNGGYIGGNDDGQNGTAGVNYGDGGGGAFTPNGKPAHTGGAGKGGYIGIKLSMGNEIYSAPSGLTGTSFSCTGITLSWVNTDTGRSGNRLYRLSGATYVLTNSLTSGTTSYFVTGLTPNTSYTFKVSHFSGIYELFSDSYYGTTLDPTPYNVTGSTSGHDLNHVVTWNIYDTAYGVSIIPLIREKYLTTWVSGTTLAKNATTYTFTGLNYNTTYEVMIVRIGTEYPSEIYEFNMFNAPPVYAAVSGTGVLCNGGSTGTLTFYNQSGGTGSFEYSINSGSSWYSTSGFTGLTIGDYECFIRETGNPTGNTYYVGQSTITEPTVLYAGIIAANQSVCSGATPALLTSIHDASGASGSYIYQWQYSVNGIGYFNIAGGTSTTYQPPALTQTTYYKRRVYDTACGIVYADYSNVITITIYPALYTGTIGSNQSIPINTAPAQLTTIVSPTGQSGAYVYQWQISSDNVTWTNIPSATGVNYQPTALLADSYFRKNVYTLCESGYTNSVLINVYGMLKPPFCGGTYYVISATTCGNSDGKIVITDVDYFNFYDITLTDTDSNSYTFNILTGEATGLTSGFYTLTAIPKQPYWFWYGKDDCTFDWIPLEDSDTSISLLATKLKHAICQGFGKQTGRIILELTDSGTTTGWTYTLYDENHILIDQQTLTGDTFTGTTNITTYLGAGKYYAIIENDSGCKYLSDLIKIQSEQLYTVTGIRRLFITPWNATTSYNYYSSSDQDWYVNGIDTLQYTSTKISEYVDLSDFWYEIRLDTAVMSYGETFQKDQNGLTYAETVTISIPKAENSKWKQLTNILTGRYIVVFQDNHDQWWTCFYRYGAEVKAYSLNENQYVITFRHPSVNKMLTSIDYSYIKNSIL